MLCHRYNAQELPRPVQAYVYKSLKKADTYVYLAARDDFTRLPEPLRTQLGTLEFVLDVGADARSGNWRAKTSRWCATTSRCAASTCSSRRPARSIR